MSFWEAVALMGLMATILGVFITIYGLINNRTLKEQAQGLDRSLKQEAKGIREILLGQQEILVRIEQGQNEARQTESEARRDMAEALKAIQQGQNTLGELVRIEGERTREAIRARP